MRSKVLASFLLVLLPMLALIIYEYNHDYAQWRDKILDDQLITGQAVSALVDASIDDAFAVAWSLSRDSVLQTMDPRLADPRLASLARSLPQFDNIAVFDLDGNAVGLMTPPPPPGAPRPNGADRRYFQNVTSTRQPAVSNVLISRNTGNPAVVAAVPMLDGTGNLKGVVIAALDLGYLAQRLQVVSLSESQAIFLTDPEGTVALHTLLPRENWGRRDLSSFPPVQSALGGVPALERNVESLVGDLRMISASRTDKYSWVVGVSIPTAEALRPVQDDLVRQLFLFALALVFASLVAVTSVHHMLFRPLKALTDTLLAFGKGQLDARVHLETRDEFEKLGSGFDWMAGEIARDITERKQTEQSFRALAESSPIGTFIVDGGKFRFVNARFQESTGYGKEELLGTDALRLVLPDDRAGVRANAVQMLKGERQTPYEYQIADKSGSLRWILETVASIHYEGKRMVVGSFMDITHRRELEQQLTHLATHDPLTGLPNRRSLEAALSRAMARSRRGVRSALLFLDLDNFKQVNDTLGHAAGDEALVILARFLQEQLRPEDLLARLGGDEFALLLDGTETTEAKFVSERICRAIAEFPPSLDHKAFNLGVSVGVAEIAGECTVSTLLSHADTAMYRAKAQGGGQVVFYEYGEGTHE